MHTRKRKISAKCIRYAVLLMYAAVFGLSGCQQPVKQQEKPGKPASQKPSPVKPANGTNTGGGNSQNGQQNGGQGNGQNNTGGQGNGQNNNGGNPPANGGNGGANPPPQGEITYQGMQISNTLSRTPQELQERIIAETETGVSTPALNGHGIPVKYIEKEVRYDISAAFGDNLLLDPAHYSIYPGAVLAGDSIDDGTYREITQGNKRKAVISFSLQGVKDKNGKPGITAGEIVPNLAAYRGLHNEILSQKISYNASAHSSYEEKAVKSEESFDVNFKVGVGFSAAGIKTKIASGFKFKSGDHKHRHLIKFVETFYTVDVNQETAPLMTDIPRTVLGDRMPVYVSSVSYGRIAYLSIETDKEWDEIKPHLETVLKASPNSAEFEVSNAIKKLKENTSITINIIGGGAEAVTTLAQFRNYIVKGGFASGNPGQIIKYKLRFLDDNATAHIKYGGQYTTVERTKVTGTGIKVTAAAKKINCHITDHGTDNGEIFGTIGIRPKNKPAQEEKIFNYDRNTNVLIVPCKSSLDIEPPEKSIIVPNSSETVQLLFNIRERNYDWAGGDRIFGIDQAGGDNAPLTRCIEDLGKQKTHIFTLYEQGKPQEFIRISIDFTVEYLF